MSVLNRLGDWMLTKALGVTEVAAGPCEGPVSRCGYCNAQGLYVECSSCYYDSCLRQHVRSGCRPTNYTC